MKRNTACGLFSRNTRLEKSLGARDNDCDDDINNSERGRWNISFNGAFKTRQGAPRGQVGITRRDNGDVAAFRPPRKIRLPGRECTPPRSTSETRNDVLTFCLIQMNVMKPYQTRRIPLPDVVFYNSAKISP